MFINVTYLYMLHVCIHKMHNNYDSIFLYKGKFHIKCLFGTRHHSFKGTHDLYFELMKVLDILLCYLLHDSFRGCLFLSSCVCLGSVG